VPARGLDGLTLPLEAGRPEQLDGQSHTTLPFVKRLVTRPTVTFPLVEINRREWEMRLGMKHALAAVLAAAFLLPAAAFAGPQFSAWGTAQKVDEIAGNSSELNTPSLDGCPIFSPDGLSLYMASNRPRFAGDTRTDLDIWVARRESTASGFGAPVNLGAPINSIADDFCPTPVRGGGLFFVSRRVTAEACGLGDVYFARRTQTGGWSEARHFACAPVGPNSALDEQGPSYVEAGDQPLLYFSRGSATVPGDIFVSAKLAGGGFGPAAAVAELNDPTANDIQPNVRKNGREVVFSSNRAGSLGQDIWSARRESLDEPWTAPVNLGGGVNTAAGETRPSFSWNGLMLLFGRAPGPEGMSDIYLTTRTKL
jgi:WD40-like Beta Propeller Repeat